jgi:hypothetical protein
MADLKDLASRYGVLKDKLNAQDFGPNDSIIASSLMHPQEAAGRASDWLQEKMRIAAGIPNQALEDEGSWYQTGIVPSMNEQAQAGLDLAGLMQTGAMPFAPASAGGTLGTFIGKNARNWDAQAAKLAEEKLNAGADPAEVWREHLIGRMPDKTLFSEISDKDANLLTPRDIEEKIAYQKTLAEGMKAGIKERNASLKVQPDLFEKDIKAYNKQKKANADLMLNEINRNFGLQDYLPMYKGVEAGQGTFSKNVYTHPELFENYPKLGEIVTRFGGQSDKFDASFTPNMGGGNIEIYYPSVKAGTKNSVMAHELQHAIQNQEGWGQGGSTQTHIGLLQAEKMVSPLKKEILDLENKYRENFDDDIGNALRSKRNDLERLNDVLRNPNLKENQAYLNNIAYKAYRRLAGEAQARATQDRLDMDMVQRRENYPLAGGKLSDIPLEDLIYKYEGNGPSLAIKAYHGTTKPIKNLNQALLDKYIERGYLPEDELVKYEKNAAKMRNAGRQDINIQNAQANPEYEAYKAEYDVPFMHGTERLDRVLSKEGLDPKRATSGPMSYGTDSPEIASSYATKKQDTSMIDDDDWDYSKAFTVSPQQLGHRGTIPYTVEQSWNYLDPEVKRDILTKAPRVGYSDLDQWQGDFVLHPEGEGNAINQSHYDYLLKQSRNNPIKAMRDYWLDSGNLFNEEEKMSQLYRLAGYPHEISQEMAPWTKREGVLTGVSRITKPLDTSNVDDLRENVIPALKQAFKNDKSRKKDYGADSWDKNTRYTPKEWVNELESDLNKGENSYVWTSIPDKITSELKRLGYNGIYDTGGKSAGADSHQVTIPFNPSQIRSKFAAFDPILKNSPNLLAGTALGSVLLRDDDQGYAEGGRVDKDSLQLDKPQRTPNHPTKSHIVKTMVDGKEKIIRFGEQGAETAGKPKEGESDRMTAKRESFKARHAKNIAKGKSSAAYWADKVKWAEGGSVSMEDLPFDDPDQLRLYHQAMQHFDDVMENTGGSKKMGKTEARINYNTTTKGDRDRDKDLHTLIADYGVDVGKGVNLNATMIKPMEAEGVYLGNLTSSVPVGEGRASLGLQGLHTKYSDNLSGYTAGYNGKVGDGNLSASYFEPADHNSAGRQVQLEYSMPFADGGSVSEFEDPAHERLYRKAMAHFDDLVNA